MNVGTFNLFKINKLEREVIELYLLNLNNIRQNLVWVTLWEGLWLENRAVLRIMSRTFSYFNIKIYLTERAGFSRFNTTGAWCRIRSTCNWSLQIERRSRLADFTACSHLNIVPNIYCLWKKDSQTVLSIKLWSKITSNLHLWGKSYLQHIRLMTRNRKKLYKKIRR